ncbi:MAG: hypothetical protein JNJ59_05595 [Deltaproteobacteria bacterium]|nr:hypothetical protein [Deltaproteobacteria bacterium]
MIAACGSEVGRETDATTTTPNDAVDAVDTLDTRESVDTSDSAVAADAVDGDGFVALDTSEFDGPGYAYLVVDPMHLDFGIRPVGETLTRELEIENAGNKPLHVTRLSFVGPDGGAPSEAFSTNRVAFVLPALGTTRVMVTFYSLDAFPYQDRLRFESDSATGTLDVLISGGGIVLECVDLDGDGFGPYCARGEDCDQSTPDVHAGAPEVCNGRDDDCDGATDEDWIGLGQSCTAGVGECTIVGQRICNALGDGLLCAANPQTGGSELCNSRDDDCDGATDEDFPELGRLCTVGTGVCKQSDKWVCKANGLGTTCNVLPIAPGSEVLGDLLDNDCDGLTDEEPDRDVGCADGEREGFTDLSQWPDIAACDGAWRIGGVVTDLLTPTCERGGGDDGVNTTGIGCNVSDLCADGWHVCSSSGDVAAHSPTGCQGATQPGAQAFYVVRQSGTGCAQCATGTAVGGACNSPYSCISGCAPNVFLSNDVFGCGSLGAAPAASCAPLDRFSHNDCNALLPPWACSGGTVEASNIVKSGLGYGGVVCCRD